MDAPDALEVELQRRVGGSSWRRLRRQRGQGLPSAPEPTCHGWSTRGTSTSLFAWVHRGSRWSPRARLPSFLTRSSGSGPTEPEQEQVGDAARPETYGQVSE